MQLNYKKIYFGLLLFATLSDSANAQTGTDTVTINSGEEASVFIGFGKQPKRLVTSAISTVKGEELQKTFNTNLGNTLYGRIAGLTVLQGNNEPGNNSPTLFGRGVSTYGPGTNLLIIIDGFLGDYTQLIPEEIEEISPR